MNLTPMMDLYTEKTNLQKLNPDVVNDHKFFMLLSDWNNMGEKESIVQMKFRQRVLRR